MTARVEWHGDEWLRDSLVPALNAGVEKAAIALQSQMIRGMGSEGGGVLRKAKKRRVGQIQDDGSVQFKFQKNRKNRGRNIYVSAPPGAYPGVRTGLLRRSMSFGRSWDDRTPGLHYARVGTNVAYGRYLELGTPRMKPRPWAMKSVGLARNQMMSAFNKAAARSLAANARRRAAG